MYKIIFPYLVLHLCLSPVYATIILKLCFGHHFIPEIHPLSPFLQHLCICNLFYLNYCSYLDPFTCPTLTSLNFRLDCHFSTKLSGTLQDWLVLFHDPSMSPIIAYLHCIFMCIFCLFGCISPLLPVSFRKTIIILILMTTGYS